jgi:hypothetical protein
MVEGADGHRQHEPAVKDVSFMFTARGSFFDVHKLQLVDLRYLNDITLESLVLVKNGFLCRPSPRMAATQLSAILNLT